MIVGHHVLIRGSGESGGLDGSRVLFHGLERPKQKSDFDQPVPVPRAKNT